MVAKNFEEAVALVEKMLEGGVVNGEELQGGDAYLDWGVFYDIYKNITSKYLAIAVGEYFKDKGYYVYYQISTRERTPLCIRIYTKPKSCYDPSRYMELY